MRKCGGMYGVSVEGVGKSVEKCVGVWRDVRKGIECVGLWREARREVGKCVGVWGDVRGDVWCGKGVEDAVECGGCGKVC